MQEQLKKKRITLEKAYVNVNPKTKSIWQKQSKPEHLVETF
jgi:hypothetical protein